MNENNMVIKDARTLGLPKMLLLGLQHMFCDVRRNEPGADSGSIPILRERDFRFR